MRCSLPFAAAAAAALCVAGAGAASAQVATNGYYNGVYYHNGTFYRGLVRPEAPVATVTEVEARPRVATTPAPAARTRVTTAAPPPRATVVTRETRTTAATPPARAATTRDTRATTAASVTVAERDEPVQPRVMGWVGVRTSDCGVYRYWDGARCVDARDVPPPLEAE